MATARKGNTPHTINHCAFLIFTDDLWLTGWPGITDHTPEMSVVRWYWLSAYNLLLAKYDQIWSLLKTTFFFFLHSVVAIQSTITALLFVTLLLNSLWGPPRESHQGNDNLPGGVSGSGCARLWREEGEGRSVVWHIEDWHQTLSERGPKLHLAKICKVWTNGGNTALTFLQGLGRGTDPLEGRFMSNSQVRKLEFTGKHISSLSDSPQVEMHT